MKLAATAYNRSRPMDKWSFQAKKLLGLGLFCWDEDNSGLLTQQGIKKYNTIIECRSSKPKIYTLQKLW